MKDQYQGTTTTTAPPPGIDWGQLQQVMADLKAKDRQQRREWSEGLEKMTCAVCGAHVYLVADRGPDTVAVCGHIMDELKKCSVEEPESSLSVLTSVLGLRIMQFDILKG